MGMENERALCLLSGGLDSFGALALSFEKFEKSTLAPSEYLETLTIDYGQRAFEQEKSAAIRISEYYGLRHRLISLPWLGSLGKSSLTDHQRDLETFSEKDSSDKLDDLEDGHARAKRLWVPNRNGLFVNIAAAVAEACGFQAVILGLNVEEAETFPDNSKEFMDASTVALSLSTLKKVRVESPTVGLNKPEILKELIRLDAPLGLVWSCYSGESKMCGKCESCWRLKRSIEKLRDENANQNFGKTTEIHWA